MNGAVRTLILERMQAVFMPPQQVRANRQARQLALVEYEQALQGFTAEVLEQAWVKVRNEHELVIWPPIRRFLDACRYYAVREGQPSPEEGRRQQALEQANAYTSRFLKHSVLAQRARAEGWLGELQNYVQAAAWVQAQLLCGVRQLGFDSVLLEEGEYRSAQAAFAAYRTQVAKELTKGEIKVRVPAARIEQWRAQAQTRERASGDLPER